MIGLHKHTGTLVHWYKKYLDADDFAPFLEFSGQTDSGSSGRESSRVFVVDRKARNLKRETRGDRFMLS